jgi:hypothetical protein
MPGQPQLSSTYIQKAIDDAAIAYGNSAYILDQIAPIVDVDQRQGKYFTFDRGESVQDAASPNRQPGSDAPRGGYTIGNESYDCKEMAFAHEIPDEIAAQADPAIQPFRRGIDFCMEKALLRRERLAAATFFAASVWGTDASVSDTWDDYVDSDPADDVNTGKTTIVKDTGFDPNVLVMGREVWDKLILHPDVLDRIKYTKAATQDEVAGMLAAWLGLERVVVGSASYNAAAEGATVDRQFIWGKDAVLLYVPAAPAKDVPSAAYTFQLAGIETRQWREESPKQSVVEASICADPVVTASKAGYRFASVVA